MPPDGKRRPVATEAPPTQNLNLQPQPNLTGYALGLAGADLPVLPLLPRTKRPRYRGGYKAATCDPARIAAHWTRYPDDNIGVRPPLGHIVVDIDPRHGGADTMRALVQAHGRLPQTWCARTGAGWHYWWFIVGETPALRAQLGPGVDIKHGGNGFVVAPPSIHPDGGRYRWLIAPSMCDPALAPGWLLRLITAPPPPPIPARVRALTAALARRPHGPFTEQCLAARITAAPVGGRHHTTLRAFLDAAKQGDLDAFTPALMHAAIGAERTGPEIEAIISYARSRA
jgi:hypothetical protein